MVNYTTDRRCPFVLQVFEMFSVILVVFKPILSLLLLELKNQMRKKNREMFGGRDNPSGRRQAMYSFSRCEH
jgi:hypothetical protein